MVKHIVMWNLADKDKVAENGAIMKQKLEALVGVVPGLLRAGTLSWRTARRWPYTRTIRPTARSRSSCTASSANACAVITRYKDPPSHPARRSFDQMR